MSNTYRDEVSVIDEALVFEECADCFRHEVLVILVLNEAEESKAYFAYNGTKAVA